MVKKKDLVIIALAAFCLTATLFMIVSTRSQSQSQYDPWVDLNDDGAINILDAITLSNHFLESGTPINKTALLLELQSKVDSLNSSLLALQSLTTYLQNEVFMMRVGYDAKFAELQTTINTLNATITELQSRNTELENRVSILETLHGLPIDWTNGLVGYWKFDEGNGTEAGDSSGNNNNGTLENGPTWVDGKYGKAVSFDGSDDYVEVPQSSTLDIVDGVSIVAWVYPKASPTFATILSRWYDGWEPDRGIVLQLKEGSYLRFGVIDTINVLDAPFTFETNKWYYIAATWNGSDSRIYVNGIEIGNRSTSGSFTNQNVNLGIGSDLNPFQAGFNGTIDNVMIYNRALTAEEVMAHYLLPPP
jgi:hypothetical protein